MSIVMKHDQYDLDPGDFADRDIRAKVRAAEARLVGELGSSVRKLGLECEDPLHLEMPDGSFQTWVLSSKRLGGRWRVVVLEENSQYPRRDVITVAPTVPLVDAGLAPLLFFAPYLDELVSRVASTRRRKRATKVSGVAGVTKRASRRQSAPHRRVRRTHAARCRRA